MRATLPLRLAASIGLALTVSAAAAAPAPKAGAGKRSLPFIRDDAPRALALAKARKLPVFVEAWAPW